MKSYREPRQSSFSLHFFNVHPPACQLIYQGPTLPFGQDFKQQKRKSSLLSSPFFTAAESRRGPRRPVPSKPGPTSARICPPSRPPGIGPSPPSPPSARAASCRPGRTARRPLAASRSSPRRRPASGRGPPWTRRGPRPSSRTGASTAPAGAVSRRPRRRTVHPLPRAVVIAALPAAVPAVAGPGRRGRPRRRRVHGAQEAPAAELGRHDGRAPVVRDATAGFRHGVGRDLRRPEINGGGRRHVLLDGAGHH
ncbi:hypothetical protein THAOC_01083, partial [Thalassiosira oceanica]